MSIKKNRKFWTGIILIILSYVFWGAFFYTVVTLKGKNKESLYFSAMLYGLNWGFFGAGILLAGKTGVRYTKSLFKKAWGFGKINLSKALKKQSETVEL
jgi:EamA domain-containing membrane protein RarD